MSWRMAPLHSHFKPGSFMHLSLNTASRFVTVLPALLLACQVSDQPTASIHPVQGAWSMASVHWESADQTVSIDPAQPGLFLFVGGSYSIQWTPTEAPRVPFEVLSAPTDEETLAGFRSIVFNAGSYELSDSLLTATASVAKVPGFEGGQQFYRYAIDGNRLTLTMFDETYPDGSKPEWSGGWETRFELVRVGGR